MSDSNDNGAAQFGRNENASNGPIIPKSANEALRPEKVPQPPKRSRKAYLSVCHLAIAGNMSFAPGITEGGAFRTTACLLSGLRMKQAAI